VRRIFAGDLELFSNAAAREMGLEDAG